MSTITPPPVGTIMRWGELQAKVLTPTPDYLVVVDGGGWLRRLQHVNGAWRDHAGEVWEIVTPDLPTLPVGTILTRIGQIRGLIVERSAPGFAYANDGSESYAMVFVDGGWRSFQNGPLWTAH